MPDESQKETNLHNSSQASGFRSMFDRWEENRLTQSRNIPEEVKEEFSHEAITRTDEFDEIAQKEALFLRLEDIWKNNKDDYGRVRLENDDVTVQIDKVDRRHELMSPVRKFEPAFMNVVPNTSYGPTRDQDEFRSIDINGLRVPEFFLHDGDVVRAYLFYIYDYAKKAFSKSVGLAVMVDFDRPKKYRIDSQVDVNKLKELPISEDVFEEGKFAEDIPLDPGDYEYLNQIVGAYYSHDLPSVGYSDEE